MRRCALVLVCFVGLHVNAAAAKRPFEVDDLFAVKVPSGPAISPDGRSVAYTIREPNWAENRYDQHIWIADVRTGAVTQLTNTKGADAAPAWSPDGRTLAFLSDRDGRRQLYVATVSGGQERQVTNVETAVSAFRWSPDGSQIAFTMADPKSAELRARADRYGDFEIARREYVMSHLWIVRVEGGAADRLTGGSAFTVGAFSWSPDGARIAFDAQPTPSMASEDDSDIYVATVAAKSVQKIVNQPGPDRNPQWSPDGRRIAFQTGMGRANFFFQDVRIGILSLDGGAIVNVTPDFDESADLAAWTADGIYVTAEQKTAAHLFHVDPASRLVERVTPQPDAVYSSFSFARDGKSVAFVQADVAHVPEVFVAALNGFAAKKLTNLGVRLDDLEKASREVVSWTSRDGTKIEGVLTKPASFDPREKHPLLVIVHGGPGVAYHPLLGFETLYYPKEIWAAKGALILEPNYRGSVGYGEAFRQLRVRNAGYGDYDDVISGVDALIAKGWVDPARMGLMGWSFGGFITAFTLTQTDRFKAVSVGAGPTDWPTFDAWTDLPQITRSYLAASPSSDPEIYRKSSPIAHINSAKTPTLIQHGELDPMTPIANAYELLQALRDLDVPARLYVYKGFGHNMTKPKAVRAVMEHNLNWFNHYIWGEPDADAGR